MRNVHRSDEVIKTGVKHDEKFITKKGKKSIQQISWKMEIKQNWGGKISRKLLIGLMTKWKIDLFIIKFFLILTIKN